MRISNLVDCSGHKEDFTLDVWADATFPTFFLGFPNLVDFSGHKVDLTLSIRSLLGHSYTNSKVFKVDLRSQVCF